MFSYADNDDMKLKYCKGAQVIYKFQSIHDLPLLSLSDEGPELLSFDTSITANRCPWRLPTIRSLQI